MADKRIDDLPDGVTGALTDLVELSRGGTSYKLLVSALMALVESAGIAPGGRITLQQGVPMMTADQTAKSRVYYDTFEHGIVPIWDGSRMVAIPITGDEVYADLDATNHTANHNYDKFAYLDGGGNFKTGFGPAWASDTTRGTGAGTTELQFKKGIQTAKNSITLWNAGSSDSVAANKATLLGTVRTSANGQTMAQMTPAAVSGGANAKMFISNAYCRRPVSVIEFDGATQWTYNSTVARPLNGGSSNVNNRITWIDTLGIAQVKAMSFAHASITSNSDPRSMVGYNSTTTGTGSCGVTGSSGNIMGHAVLPPAMGLNYAQALEFIGNGSSSSTWFAFGLFSGIKVELEN